MKKSLQGYADKLETIRKELVATKEGLGITGEERIREKLSELYGTVVGYDGRPTDSQLDRLKGLTSELKKQNDLADAIWKNDLPKVNAALKGAKMNTLSVMTKEEFDKTDNSSIAPSGKGFNYRFPFSL